MPRVLGIAALLLACTLALAARLIAQDMGDPGVVYTPENQLGSIPEPPMEEELPANPVVPYVSNAPPASTALLATRHFDFIVAPFHEVIPGCMEDTSISLGDYARELRARKQAMLPPNAIASPAK